MAGPGIWALVGLLVIYLLHRVMNDPLRKIPGPFIAKFTDLWIVIQCRLLRRSRVVVDMHRKYGKFVRISTNHISIADPRAMQEVYGHRAALDKGPFYDAFFQVRPVIFTARDPKVHSIKRKYLNAGFSARALSAFEPRMDVNIRNLKQVLIDRCEGPHGPRLDFCTWSNYLAFDVIADFAFGKPFGFLLSQEDPENLVHVIDTRGEVLNALGHVPCSLRPFMKYFFCDKFWSQGLAARSNLEALGRQSYDERKSRSGDTKDLLGLLFSVKSPQDGSPLQSDEIIAEAISFIVGGSDTTSSTMTNFVDMVSRQPGVQKRLQDELDETFGDVHKEWIAPDSIAGTLPYLNAVLKEVMRIRPTSSTGLERVVPAGGREIAGKYLPEHTLVSVPTAAIMQDPDVFKDPESFNPDRWLDESSANLIENFHPFSTGPRSCIGRNFAWMEMAKTIATIFRMFHFTRTIETASELREGFFVKSKECWVEIKKR